MEKTELDEMNELDAQGASAENAEAPEEEASDRELMAIELEGRSAFYRTLATWFYEPLSQGQVDSLDADALRQLSEDAPDALMAEGYNDMYRYMRRRNTGTRESLNVDFTRCFMGTATFHGLACAPYASLFLNAGGRMMGQARNDVRRFYRKNQIALDSTIDLPEDHLSFELEFMAILGDRAAEAVRAGDDARSVELIELQAQFLNDHVLTWTDRFFNLSVELVRTRFYRGVVKVTRGFLASEIETLAFLRAEIAGLAPAADAR